MDDLIRRQAAIEAIQKLYPGMPRIDVGDRWYRWRKENDQYIECEDAIKKLPSVVLKIECGEVVKDLAYVKMEKKGKWIKREGLYQCSACEQFFVVPTPFCPNCGADTREENQ